MTDPMHRSQFDLEDSYDVAISLLNEDVGVVGQFFDELAQHVRGPVFFYAPIQDKLIGEHGPSVFANVFRRRARVVVIFLRQGWGARGYTRLEHDAICDRYLEGGDPRSIIVVRLDDSEPPDWFTGSRMIWAQFPERSLRDLAIITADRVDERGGSVGRESVVEKARRHRERAEAMERKALALRTHGNRRFAEELPRVVEALVRRVNELRAEAGAELKYGQNQSSDEHAVIYEGDSIQTLVVAPERPPFVNNRSLFVAYATGRYSVQGRVFPQPDISERHELSFEPVDDDLWLWGTEGEPRYTSEDLVEWALERLIDRAYGKDAGRPPIRWL